MTPSTTTRAVSLRDPIALGWWLLLALVVGAVLFIRIRLLPMPLERDEGEYAYAGQLMLRGIPPYKFAYNMKFPGAYAAYAFFMALFGQTPAAIHLGLLLVNLATAVLLVLVARRLTLNSPAAAMAGAAYLVSSLSPSVLGLAAHVEHFVVLPVTAALLLLLRDGALNPWRVCFSGALSGVAIAMKQPALFFVVALLVWLLCRKDRRIQNAALFSAGAVSVIAIMFGTLWASGVFPAFWFWTIDYARAYGGIVPWREGLLILSKTAPHALLPFWPICALAAVGAVALCWRRELRPRAVTVVLLLAGAVVALSAGLYFREHYYIYLLPIVALLAAVACTTVVRGAALTIVIAAASGAYPLARDSQLFFNASPHDATAQIYRGNIFAEAPAIGAFLREQSAENDTIAVIGSEPEIYFYARRQSATGYIYTYALMEEHPYARHMQEEMQREIERAAPKFLLLVAVPMSWGIGAWSDLSLINWVNDYNARNYHPIGAVNISADGRADYCLPCNREMDPWPPSVLICERNTP